MCVLLMALKVAANSAVMRKVSNCHKCGQVMYKHNLLRHMKAVHGEDVELESNPPSNCSSVPNSRDPSPAVFDRKGTVSVTELATDSLEYLIQGAVYCMLRREVRNDLPTLREYLAARFPDLPAHLRDAVIITTFKTAQKVSVTHTEALLPEEDYRGKWARKALGRWGHGLSFPEPPLPQPDDEPLSELAKPDEMPPAGTFLANKELPVPVDSEFLRKEAERDFHQATQLILEEAGSNLDNENGDQSHGPVVLNTIQSTALELTESSLAKLEDKEATKTVASAPAKTLVEATMTQPIVTTPLNTLEDGEIAELTDVELLHPTFTDLLQVDGKECDPFDDLGLYRPLSNLTTPVVTPRKKSQKSQEVPEAKKSSDDKRTTDTDAKSAPHVESNESETVQNDAPADVSQTSKKARVEKLSKENAKPLGESHVHKDNDLKRKVPVKKQINKDRPTPITWKEKGQSSKLKSTVSVCRPDVEPDDDDYRRPMQDYKIPFKQRNDSRDPYPEERIHPLYREEEFRRRGFGRGFLQMRGVGRGRSRCHSFSRPPGVPSFTVEQEKWLDKLNPHGVPKFNKVQQRWLDEMMPAWANRH